MCPMLIKLVVEPFLLKEQWPAISFLSNLMIGWGELSRRNRLRLALLSWMRQQKVGM